MDRLKAMANSSRIVDSGSPQFGGGFGQAVNRIAGALRWPRWNVTWVGAIA